MSSPKPHKRNTYKDSSFLGYKENFEKFSDKPLTEAKADEMRANLVKFVELLIELDVQHTQWASQRATLKKYDITN